MVGWEKGRKERDGGRRKKRREGEGRSVIGWWDAEYFSG